MDNPFEVIIRLGIMCLIMGIVMYLLYRHGWMVVNAKSAVSFVGSKGGKSASFSGCSGHIKRIIRFCEDRTYTFTLDAALTKGSMTVLLLDPGKKEILRLNTDAPSAAVELEKRRGYTLILRFQSATGRYRLQWD